MSDVQVVLCNLVRTPIGTYNGSLKSVPAATLGATVLREVLRRAGLAPEKNVRMRYPKIILLSILLLVPALPSFAQPVSTSANPVQRELVYCADQMSHEEREAYRAKMQAAPTREAKDVLRAQHRREMQERARVAGLEGQCEPQAQGGGGPGYRGGRVK